MLIYFNDTWADAVEGPAGLAWKSITVPEGTTKITLQLGANAAGTCKVKAAKFELGNHFTGWNEPKFDALRLLVDKPTPQPNLIVNGLLDTNHLVNQRGQSSYTSESTTSYGPDRWRLVGVNADIQSDGVRVYRPDIGNYGWLDQPMELLATYAGKEVTLAVMMDGKTLVTTAQIPIDPPTYIDCGAIQLPTGDRWTIGVEGETGRMSPKLYIAAGQSYKIQAVKLESGPRFTGWDNLMFSETLAECQRYFLPIKRNRLVGHQLNDAIYCFLPTPVTMRTTPVIKSGTVYKYHSNGFVSIENPVFTEVSVQTNGISLMLKDGTNMTAMIELQADDLTLSADL